MEKTQQIKSFQVRLPKELWAYLKKKSVDLGLPMSEIICDAIILYRKNMKKNVDKK